MHEKVRPKDFLDTMKKLIASSVDLDAKGKQKKAPVKMPVAPKGTSK